MMDYVLLQNVDKNLIYYGVYSTDSELCDGSDILCSARKKYFETGVTQHSRSTLKTPYETFRYLYHLEAGQPLKFKKLKGSVQIERVVPDAEGYFVETTDFEHHPIKKTFFNNQHLWLKTEFFSLSDRSSPIFVLFPSTDDEQPIILRKVRNGRTDTLYPFNISLDKKLTEKLNVIVNEPRVYCVTSSGSFYYCTNEEFKERRKALDKLLEKEKRAEETEETTLSDTREPVTPAFVIDSSKLDDKSKSAFSLKNSTEIRISDGKPVDEQPDTNEDFFAQIEQIAKKNNIDIDTVRSQTQKKEETLSAIDQAEPREPKTSSRSDKLSTTKNTAPTEKVSEEPHKEPKKSEHKKEEHKNKKRKNEDFSSAFAAFHLAQPEESVPEQALSASAAEAADEQKPIITPHRSQKTEGQESEEAAPLQSTCGFSSECPYEMIDKQIIEAGGRQYYYFGDLDGSKRNGKGRTVMKNGDTAYEGQYLNDKRNGFGVYYYKSGKLCYTGNWKNNQREGLGVAFSPTDGSAFIGEWKEDQSVNVGASFDSKGRMLYAGYVNDGKRNGAGITYNDEDRTFFVGKYKEGEFLGTGTQFDGEGNLLYTGEYTNNQRSGSGTSYYPDGTVAYQGKWLNNLYDGEGTLHMDDGSILKGSFKNGKAYGKCTLTDSVGKVIYQGSFVDDTYNGSGRLYSDDGGYVEGRFVDGEPTGIFNEYTKDKKLVYCGEWMNMHRSGRGIEYRDGEKLYEGEFEHSFYNGEGKLFENGRCVYSGSFVKGKRCGYGVEFQEGEIIYRGLWNNDRYNGSGILYRDGEVRFVGMFEDGMRNGRINEIKNHKVIRKSLYKENTLVYMCEYTNDGQLAYYGGVRDKMRNGMGCSFMASCEKQFEGIFKDGKQEKPMKVVLKELPTLPLCKELEDTEYELYRRTPQYIIEKPITNGSTSGIYTGRLKDGMPDGSGTILYSDHRYTGIFVEGKPEGEGMIYMNDGRQNKGYFSTKPFTDCETLILADITYYYSEVR